MRCVVQFSSGRCVRTAARDSEYCPYHRDMEPAADDSWLEMAFEDSISGGGDDDLR